MTSSGPTLLRGFTLLEMVVVLSIIGLTTAIAVPAMLQGMASWKRKGEVELVLDQVRGLPAAARARGSDLVISQQTLLAGPDAPIKVGEDSTLTTGRTWRVRYNGLCEGGIVQLQSDGRIVNIEARAPFCDPHEMP